MTERGMMVVRTSGGRGRERQWREEREEYTNRLLWGLGNKGAREY